MKKMKLEVMILGVAIAVVVYAQEAPADENDPLNAVVKLEVSTAKPDIFCPWANYTEGSFLSKKGQALGAVELMG